MRWTSFTPSRSSWSPSGRIPVPASKMMSWFPQRTSTQAVFPPYLNVDGPGVGTVPLVPQNLIEKSVTIGQFLRELAPRGRLGQFFNPHIAELNAGSMAEQADVASGTRETRMFFENGGIGDGIEVGIDNSGAIQVDGDVAAVRGNFLAVPFPVGFLNPCLAGKTSYIEP